MIVITGATGFVGSRLVSRLEGRERLLLVSRDPEAARRRFPGIAVCDHAALSGQDLTNAVFYHLAARNNDRAGTLEEFRSVNVEHLIEVATVAKAGGAACFINLCSTHALQPRPDDNYGLSKQEGARALAALWPERGINLYVPALYGDGFHGRLAVLNKVPAIVQPLALALLRQVKPVLSIDHLLKAVRALAARPGATDDPWRSEQYVADPVVNAGIFGMAKRAIDLLAAMAVIITLGWLMLLVALYVRFDSKGPAIFAQKRVGRGGRVFTCYKFRTMTVGTADAATHNVSVAAVTSAGRFLRRTKLDELPQVANVLMNDMSFVGPRPCLPLQAELVARRGERGVLAVKPGITGLAQIHDIDMSDPGRLAAWDDRYRAFRTLLGDFVILVRTVLGGGAGDRTIAS